MPNDLTKNQKQTFLGIVDFFVIGSKWILEVLQFLPLMEIDAIMLMSAYLSLTLSLYQIRKTLLTTLQTQRFTKKYPGLDLLKIWSQLEEMKNSEQKILSALLSLQFNLLQKFLFGQNDLLKYRIEILKHILLTQTLQNRLSILIFDRTQCQMEYKKIIKQFKAASHFSRNL